MLLLLGVVQGRRTPSAYGISPRRGEKRDSDGSFPVR